MNSSTFRHQIDFFQMKNDALVMVIKYWPLNQSRMLSIGMARPKWYFLRFFFSLLGMIL